MIEIGADSDYIAGGNSFFTVETTIKYLNETLAGQQVKVLTKVLMSDGKKVKLFHEMKDEADHILASCEQFMLHVNLTTRKSCLPLAHVQTRMDALPLRILTERKSRCISPLRTNKR